MGMNSIVSYDNRFLLNFLSFCDGLFFYIRILSSNSMLIKGFGIGVCVSCVSSLLMSWLMRSIDNVFNMMDMLWKGCEMCVYVIRVVIGIVVCCLVDE